MVSISDVAKEAHVSKMTVSRVLNHPEKVSTEIIQNVQTAIKKLGYVQNRAGRALATQQHFTIAFLMLDDISTVDPYFGQLITYVSDILYQSGYTLELHTNINDKFHAIDGILVSGARRRDISLLQTLPYPIVNYGYQHGISNVDIDNHLGIQIAKQHLIDSGYQRLVYLGLDLVEPFADERLNGFRTQKSPTHITEEVYLIQNNDLSAKKLVNEIHLTQSTGIVAASDRIALGALYSCIEQGLSIPEKVGIVGFDGIFIHQLSPLILTTIEQPLKGIAQTMVKQLLQAINQPTLKNIETILQPHLHQGETTPPNKINPSNE